MTVRTTSILDVPKEILCEFFSYFKTPAEVCTLQRVCKKFLFVAEQAQIWRPLCERYCMFYSHFLTDSKSNEEVSFQLIFKQAILQNVQRKGQLLIDLQIEMENPFTCDQRSSISILKRNEAKVNSVLAKVKQGNQFEKDRILKNEAALIFNEVLDKCYVESDLEKMIYNYPRALRLLFDFFEADFNYSPENFLDAWIQDRGLRCLETDTRPAPYFLKAYFLYCIFQLKDLTTFVAALKRNLEAIEPIEMVSSVQEEVGSFNLSKEEKSDIAVHSIILNQFLGLKGFIQGLCFTHLIQCQGIDIELFSPHGSKSLKSFLHVFLQYVSSFSHDPSGFFSDPQKRIIADSFARHFPDDVQSLLKKYQFTVGSQRESIEDLSKDAQTLLNVPKVNLKLKTMDGQRLIQEVQTMQIHDSIKKVFFDFSNSTSKCVQAH